MAHLQRNFAAGPALADFTAQQSRVGHQPFSVGNLGGSILDSNGVIRRVMSPEEGMREFFGVPKNRHINKISDNSEQELYDLPEAYTGSNQYLTKLIISELTEGDMAIIKKWAPWKKNEGSMVITWDRILFNDHMLGRTPEESVSRLINSKKSTMFDSMERSGIALMLEHGFFNTPAGRMRYAKGIQQIRNAIQETCAQGAAVMAMNVEVYSDGNEIYRDNPNRAKAGLDQLLSDEISQFAELQKTVDGFDNIITRMKTEMSNRPGVRPDIVCIPNGTESYINGLVRGEAFSETGHKLGATPDLVKLTLRGTGLEFFESRGYRQGEHQPSVDPNYQDKVIGGFFQVSGHFVRQVPVNEFNIAMLDVVIYNEDSDGFELFGYRENLNNLGLFEKFDDAYPELSQFGRDYFGTYNSWLSFLRGEAPTYIDYIVNGIMSKDANTKAKFVEAMMGPVSNPVYDDQENNFSDPRVARRDESDSQEFFAGRHNGGYGNDDLDNESTQDWFVRTVNRLGLPEDDASWLNAFLNRLEELDIQSHVDSSVGLSGKLKEFVDTIDSATPTFVSVVSSELNTALLEFDINNSLQLAAAGRVDEDSLTALELLVKDSDDSENTVVLGDLKNSQKKADKESGHWKSGGKAVTPLLYTEPQSTAELKLKSLALTLSSSHLVLFKVPAPSKLITNKGVIETDVTDTFRAGALQYSASISLVYSILLRLNAEAEAEGRLSDDKVEKAVKELNQAVATGIFDDRDDYVGVLQRIKDLKFTCLESQKSLLSFIVLSQRIVNDQINGKKITGTTLKRVMASFKDLFDGFHSKSYQSGSQFAVSGKPTGRYAQPYALIMSDRGPAPATWTSSAKAELVKMQADATAKAGANSDRIEHAFTVKEGEFIQMYHVAKVRDFSVKFWKSVVTQIVELYASINLGNSSETVKIDLITEWYYTLARDNSGDIPEFSAWYKDDLFKQTVKDRENEINALRSEMRTILNFSAVVNQPRHEKTNNRFYTQNIKVRKEALKNKNVIGLSPVDAAILRLHVVLAGKAKNAAISDTDIQGAVGPNYLHRLDSILFEALAITSFKTDPTDVNTFINKYFINRTLEHVGRDTLAQIRRTPHPTSVTHSILEKWGFTNPQINKLKGKDASEIAEVKKAGSDAANNLTEKDIYRLLDTPGINGGFIHFCESNNVMPPIGFRGIRHLATYTMGTAWMSEGGGRCANTLYGHADMQMADDAARKIHYGHFTIYFKTVVWANEKIVHAPNIYCKAYVGGNGTLVWNNNDINDIEAYRGFQYNRDIHLIPTPIGTYTNSRHMDITGSYHPALQAHENASLASAIYNQKVMVELWGFDTQQRNPLDRDFGENASVQTNTICFQEHQGVWNHASKAWNRIITNKGHWGENVYPGCGKTRRGGCGTKVLRQCNYNSMISGCGIEVC